MEIKRTDMIFYENGCTPAKDLDRFQNLLTGLNGVLKQGGYLN